MTALDASAANLDSDSNIADAPGEASGSIVSEIWRRIIKSPAPLASLIVVAIYLGIGILGLTPAFDKKIAKSYSLDKSSAPPSLYETLPDGKKAISPACWFGLDIAGRSVFWKSRNCSWTCKAYFIT